MKIEIDVNDDNLFASIQNGLTYMGWGFWEGGEVSLPMKVWENERDYAAHFPCDDEAEAAEDEPGPVYSDTYETLPEHTLDENAVRRGVQLLTGPGFCHLLGPVFDGTADAFQAGCFVQLCIFGEERYC